MTTLRPGRYDVSAELDGFKKATRSGVQLDGGATISWSSPWRRATSRKRSRSWRRPRRSDDVTLRKTVEAKNIELLSSGRNPIGVPALKPGVVGGNFNNAGFAAFTNGGFSMNGSRADETRSPSTAQSPSARGRPARSSACERDAIQEVQVLTANYLPDVRARSGSQIRFITKSGSSRYPAAGRPSTTTACRPTPGSASAARTPSRTAGRAVRLQAYGGSFGGPPGE